MNSEEARAAADELYPRIKTHADYVEWKRLRELAGAPQAGELPADAEEKLLSTFKDRPMD